MTNNSNTIAHLNDLLRTTMGIGGRVFQTTGISALPEQLQSMIRERVRTFNEFTEDNDPYNERDLGSFELSGQQVLFKIDYYDADMEQGSENQLIQV